MMSRMNRKPLLLWMDLTHDRSTETLSAEFVHRCDCRLAREPRLTSQPNERQPDMLCMHFDRPDALGLNLLLELKRSAPSLPITMFTVQHSEELAVWAMRSRVWEYMVLPLHSGEKERYLSAVEQLCQLRWQEAMHPSKPQIEHGIRLPESICQTRDYQKQKVLHKALCYIEQHFREGIEQKVLAQHCGLTPFRLCRLFKEEVGVSFSEYLLRKRMHFAQELLRNSQLPITSIGYEIGFKDPSYFTRAFKQCCGLTPSDYRQMQCLGSHLPEIKLAAHELQSFSGGAQNKERWARASTANETAP